MNKIKFLFCLFIMLLSFFYIGNLFSNINILDFILSDNKKKIVIDTLSLETINNNITLSNTKKLEEKKVVKKESSKVTKNLTADPIIYIYNTHQTEEYKTNAYNITPTVETVSSILKEELKDLGIASLVEQRSITKEVNKRGLDYTGTYEVSFEYLREMQKKHKTLRYYFDMHRDSVTGAPARTTINNKKYATMMFLVGTKNKNYKKNVKNLKYMESYLKKHYKGLVRETYYQSHSAFNQFHDENMFLVELGGPDNTLEEIYNTTKALAEAIKYYVEVENEE